VHASVFGPESCGVRRGRVAIIARWLLMAKRRRPRQPQQRAVHEIRVSAVGVTPTARPATSPATLMSTGDSSSASEASNGSTAVGSGLS
jgi:hypothetical protein